MELARHLPLNADQILALTWFELTARNINTKHSLQALEGLYDLLSGKSSVSAITLYMTRLLAASHMEGDDMKNALVMLRLIDTLEWFNTGLEWGSAEVVASISQKSIIERTQELGWNGEL